MCKFSDFVNIESNMGQFEPDDMISVCKRENNGKRDFLFVNKYQGKHVPCKPSDTIMLFEDLRMAVVNDIRWHRDESICVIGFAETATAIGAYIADNLPNINVYYIHTTREQSNEPTIIDFKEEHSHATEQRLCGDLQEMKKCDRILFVDDEISTGKTIINAIRELESIYPNHWLYSVASFLNLQDKENRKKFDLYGIETFALIRGTIKDMDKKLEIEPRVDIDLEHIQSGEIIKFVTMNTFGYTSLTDRTLFLGLEEDMYIGLMTAYELEKQGHNVYFQATTRSPIFPSGDKNYILQNRIQFPCFKDKDRKTYMYNLNMYKQIIVCASELGYDSWKEKCKKILAPLCNCLTFCDQKGEIKSEFN